jgi:hypothetical protein
MGRGVSQGLQSRSRPEARPDASECRTRRPQLR